MKEITLEKKKNGMLALLLILLTICLSVFLFVISIRMDSVLLGTLSIVIMIIDCVTFAGLKVLKPQEALVLTLFGKYIGTLKGEGFYFVNPFCTSINPAAKTSLSQSGDVKKKVTEQGNVEVSMSSNKISLKMMTLNNAVQKINDCLGNPVEIGIAVIWKVNDTYKAVFNVDNYKEYLSLQCDSALRNVVRIYPYDVASNVDTTGDGIADDGSLRGSSEVVAKRIKEEIQEKVKEVNPFQEEDEVFNNDLDEELTEENKVKEESTEFDDLELPEPKNTEDDELPEIVTSSIPKFIEKRNKGVVETKKENTSILDIPLKGFFKH